MQSSYNHMGPSMPVNTTPVTPVTPVTPNAALLSPNIKHSPSTADYDSSALNSFPNNTRPYPSSTISPEPTKKKQKRNKPTLSCEECVERKTKVSDIVLNASSIPMWSFVLLKILLRHQMVSWMSSQGYISITSHFVPQNLELFPFFRSASPVCGSNPLPNKCCALIRDCVAAAPALPIPASSSISCIVGH
jgi:hypothetical protein